MKRGGRRAKNRPKRRGRNGVSRTCGSVAAAVSPADGSSLDDGLAETPLPGHVQAVEKMLNETLGRKSAERSLSAAQFEHQRQLWDGHTPFQSSTGKYDNETRRADENLRRVMFNPLSDEVEQANRAHAEMWAPIEQLNKKLMNMSEMQELVDNAISQLERLQGKTRLGELDTRPD